jgi:hypothetical protein
MKKKILALLTAAAVTASCTPVLGGSFEASAATAGSAKVTVTACGVKKANTFDLEKKTLTVSGDTAEDYGYTDNGDTSKVTALDVFAAMHAAKYGKSFSSSNATDYLVCKDGWLTKVFGKETMNVGYTVNHDTVSTTASETTVESGDRVDLIGYQDTTNYSDYKTAFTSSSKTVYTGQVVKLKLVGAPMFTSWSKRAAITGSKVTAAAVVNGRLRKISGATPDSKGVIRLKFVKAGTYHISALGTVGKKKAPISQPWCTVTVKKAKGFTSTKPVVTAKASGRGLVKVSWKKVSGAKGYVIYRAEKAGGKYYRMHTKTLGSSDRSWKISSKSGKTYYYKVRAYKYSGGKKVWTKYSAGVKCVAK